MECLQFKFLMIIVITDVCVCVNENFHNIYSDYVSLEFYSISIF